MLGGALDNPVTRKIVTIVIIGVFLPIIILILQGYLPAELPPDIINSIGFIASFLYSFNFLLPIDTLLSLFIFGMSLQIGFMIVNLLLAVFGWINKN